MGLLRLIRYALAPADVRVKVNTPRSSHWSAVRRAWLQSYPTCAACGTDQAVEVHHAVPVHVDPARELDDTNFVSLCESRHCHRIFGHVWDWRDYNPDVREDAARFLAKVRSRAARGGPTP